MPEGIGYTDEEIAAGGAPIDELGVVEEAPIGAEIPVEAEVEVPVGEIPEENLTEIEPETGATSGVPMTAEDIPELADLEIGDSITFQIDDRAEDGTYLLSVAQEVPPPVEPAPATPLGPEEQAIAQSLI